MTAAGARVLERVRSHLARHAQEAFRPVPLAQALRLPDVRLVKQALKALAEGGEAVTCLVIKDGIEETEYRISCGGPSVIHRPVLYAMNDRPVRRSETGGKFVERNPPERPAVGRQAAPLPAGKDSIPAGAAQRARRGVHRGPLPIRQDMILDLIEKRAAPTTSRHLIDAFQAMRSDESSWSVYCAVTAMVKKGHLVHVGEAPNAPGEHGKPKRLYVTRRMAASGNNWAAPPAAIAAEPPPEAPAPTAPGYEDLTPRKAPEATFGYSAKHGLMICYAGIGVDLTPELTLQLVAFLKGRFDLVQKGTAA